MAHVIVFCLVSNVIWSIWNDLIFLYCWILLNGCKGRLNGRVLKRWNIFWPMGKHNYPMRDRWQSSRVTLPVCVSGQLAWWSRVQVLVGTIKRKNEGAPTMTDMLCPAHNMSLQPHNHTFSDSQAAQFPSPPKVEALQVVREGRMPPPSLTPRATCRVPPTCRPPSNPPFPS